MACEEARRWGDGLPLCGGVLLVSGSEKGAGFLRRQLPPGHAPAVAGSAGAARQMLANAAFDLVLINAPLPDEFGDRLALEAQHRYDCGVLLLVKEELYEQTVYTLEHTGVLCLSKPCGGQMIYQAVRLLAATQRRLGRLREKNQTLQSKMEEIRLVDRAKCLLIQRFQMDEVQAHRSIEKQAMDTRSTRRQVAENILHMYENL